MSFLKACKEEFGLYFYDKYLLSSVSIAVFAVFVLMICMFGDGIVRSLPIGVIDKDHSSVSRNFVRHLDASSVLHVKRHFRDKTEAVNAIRSSDIYAFVIVPEGFEKDIKRSSSPSVMAFYNTQFVLVGRSINANLTQVVETFNAKISVLKTLFLGDKKLSQAINENVPFGQQMTPLYNINLNYSKFLLTIILPCIWQIFMVTTLILNFSTQKRKTSIALWLERGAFKAFASKLFVHQIFMFFWFLIFLVYFYMYQGWRMQGDILHVIFSGYLTILASQAVACLIYFTTFDPARSLSMAAAYTAPSLAFAGITFPFSDMSTFAQIWNYFIPISHYINIQISQAVYGVNILENKEDIIALLGFNVAFLVLVLVVRNLNFKKFAL